MEVGITESQGEATGHRGVVAGKAGVWKHGRRIESQRLWSLAVAEFNSVDALDARVEWFERWSADENVILGMAIREWTRGRLSHGHSFVQLGLQKRSRAKRGEGILFDVDAAHGPAAAKRCRFRNEIYEIGDALLFAILMRDVGVGVHAENADSQIGMRRDVRVHGGCDRLRLQAISIAVKRTQQKFARGS